MLLGPTISLFFCRFVKTNVSAPWVRLSLQLQTYLVTGDLHLVCLIPEAPENKLRLKCYPLTIVK